MVRAKAVAADMLDSYVAARTYVFGETTNLRVVAVSGDWAALNGTGGVLNTGTVRMDAQTGYTVSGCIVNYTSPLMLQSPAIVTVSNVEQPLVLTASAIEPHPELFLGTTSTLTCELITADVLGTQGAGTITIRPTGTPAASDLSLNASSGVVAAAADQVFQDLSSQPAADLGDVLPAELNAEEFAQLEDPVAVGAALATNDWLAPV